MKQYLAFFILIFSVQTYAQKDLAPSSPTLSVGFETAIPLRSFNIYSNIGLGGSIKMAFPISSRSLITANAGFIRFSSDYIGFNFIPLKVGLQYKLVENFYLEPQVGVTFVTGQNVQSETAFTYALNLGFKISRKVEIAPRYETVSKNGVDRSIIGIRLGFGL